MSEGTANHGDKETLRFSQTQGSRGSQSLRMIPVLSEWPAQGAAGIARRRLRKCRGAVKPHLRSGLARSIGRAVRPGATRTSAITAIFALIISVAPCLRSDPSPP